MSIVDADVDTSCFRLEDLSALRETYRQLHETADFVVVLRSAWVCPSRSGWRLLEEFLRERHSHDGQGIDVCLVATLAETDPMFDRPERDAIAALSGFREIVRVSAIAGDR